MPHAQSSVARCPRLCLILVGVLGVARLGWRGDTCREGVPLKTAPGTAPEGRCSKIHVMAVPGAAAGAAIVRWTTICGRTGHGTATGMGRRGPDVVVLEHMDGA